MAEILTESYCERCGAKFTFESPAATSGPVTRARTFARGLRNYLTSDESLDEAIAEARREQDRQASGIQLRAFHDTFSFCFTCRQYTCRDCWNESAGRCRTCAPMPDAPDPLDLRRLQAELTRLEEPAESEAWVAERLEPLTVDVLSWPSVEASEAEQTTPEPAAAATTATEPETGPGAGAVPQAGAIAIDVDAGIAREPAWAAAEAIDSAAVPPAAELMEPAELAEGVSVDLPEIAAATEPAGEPEVERAVGVEASEVETAAAESLPAAPEALAPDARTSGPFVQEPVAATSDDGGAPAAIEAVPEPAVPAQSEISAAEPEAAPVSPAVGAPAAESFPAVHPATPATPAAPAAPATPAAPGPAPAVQPAVAPVAPPVPIRQPRPPATGPAPWQVVAPDERPSPAPGGPGAQPGDAAQRQMGWMLRRRENPVPQVSPRITRSVWEESTRDLVAHTGSGIQACQGCGLPLSASARFCRRCGAQQV